MKKWLNILFGLSVMLSGSAHLQAQNRVELTLDDCQRKAAENSIEAKDAALDVNSAKALKMEALTEFFPSVGLVGGAYRAFSPLLNVELRDILGDSDAAQNIIERVETMAPLYGVNTSASFLDYGYDASVALSQPLFAGGRIVNGNRLASLNYESAQLKQSIAVRDNSLEVEQKYWRVVSLEEKMATVEQSISMVDTLARNARMACLAGIVLDTDTLAVNIERSRLLSVKTELKSGIRLAKMDLFDAVGIEYSPLMFASGPDRPFIDDITLADRPSEALSPENYYVDETEAAYGSEESQLLSLNVSAARIQKKMALGEALPQVGVGVTYGYGRLTGDTGRWNGVAYVMVKIPLTDYGKASCKMSRLENEVKKAENRQQRYTDAIVLNMRKMWEELSCAYDKIAVAQQAVDLSRISKDRKLKEYSSGQATISDVIAAQVALKNREDELTDARIAYQSALSAYRSHSGK